MTCQLRFHIIFSILLDLIAHRPGIIAECCKFSVQCNLSKKMCTNCIFPLHLISFFLSVPFSPSSPSFPSTLPLRFQRLFFHLHPSLPHPLLPLHLLPPLFPSPIPYLSIAHTFLIPRFPSHRFLLPLPFPSFLSFTLPILPFLN